MRRLLLGLALAIAVVPGGNAAEWVYVAKTVDGDAVFVSSITRTSKTNTRVWVKSVLSGGSYLNALDEYNCSSGYTRSVHVTAYTPSGILVGSSDAPGPWTAVVPDSIGEKLLLIACGRGV